MTETYEWTVQDRIDYLGLSYGHELHSIAHAVEAIGLGMRPYGVEPVHIDGRGWRIECDDDGVVTVTIRIAIAPLTNEGPEG